MDSYQATQLTEFLRKLADSGKTIIAVIHQPSQHVFAMFDDLLLLSEGHMMYFGEVDKVRSYFQNLGYECERETGTAEFILDTISRTNGGSEEQEKSTKRINHIASEASRQLQNMSFEGDNAVSVHDHHHTLKLVSKKRGPSAGILRQFKLLFTRSLKEVSRGKVAMIIKLVQQVSLGVIYGGIYKVGNNQVSDANVSNHFVFQKHWYILKPYYIRLYKGFHNGSLWTLIIDCHWSNEHGSSIHYTIIHKRKSNRFR